MAEFGFAGKVQSTDKNEGFTGDVVKEHAARITQSSSNPLSTPMTPVDMPTFQMNQGIASLAKSISSVAEVAKQEGRADSTMKLALKAKAQQGTDIAINDVAAEKKRSPFMSVLLGQTVTYRAAEAQSIANVSTQMMNHAYEEMSKLAELPQEQAVEQMTKYGEDLVQGIKDPELRDYAFTRVKAMMPEMAELHYKKRYTLQRNRQIENNREHIVATKDLFQNRLKATINPKKKEELVNTYRDNIFNLNDPLGVNQDTMSVAEQRGLVLNQVGEDLQNGDSFMYNLIRGMQKDDPRTLTQTEQESLRAAEGKYDSHQNTMAGQVMSETTLSLLGNKTHNDFKTTARTARASLKNWANEGTQSEVDTKNVLARQAQLETMLAQGEKNWITQGVASAKDDMFKNMNQWGAEGRAQIEFEFAPNKKQQDGADNFSVTKAVMNKTRHTEATANVDMNTILSEGLNWRDRNGDQKHMTPVDSMLYIREQIKGNAEAGTRLNSLVDNTLIAMKVGDVEDGKKWSDSQKTMFNAVDALARNNSQFKLTDDQNIRFAHLRDGFRSNESADVVRTRIENALKANSEGMKDMSTKSGKEKQADLRSLAKKALKVPITDAMLSELTPQWERAQAASLYNNKIAEEIFTGNLYSGASSLVGVLIPNGKRLEEQIQYTDDRQGGTGETSEFTLETLFKFAGEIQRAGGYDNPVSNLTPHIMAMMGSLVDRDGNNFTDMSRQMVTNVEYTNGASFVNITSAVDGSTYSMPIDEIRALAKAVTIDNAQKTKVWEATYGAQGQYIRAVDRIDNTSPITNPSMKTNKYLQ